MTLGLVGQKCGMTRIFSEDGQSIPVTVVKVTPNHISQIKTVDNDGYCAVQVTAGTKKASHVNKALTGHFAKAKVEPGRGLWEFRLPVAAELTVGESLTVEMFENQAFVDVTSTSIGKGFAGVIKRHNFSMQDATHGNSLSHRAHGSTGQCQDPGRVFKGKKMAGQLGNKRCTVQNQQLVKIDKERELLFIKGTVPGSKGSSVTITPAVKKTAKEESK